MNFLSRKWTISAVFFTLIFITLSIYFLIKVNHQQQEIESNHNLIEKLNKIEEYIRETSLLHPESFGRDQKEIYSDFLKLSIPLQENKKIGKYIKEAMLSFEKALKIEGNIILSEGNASDNPSLEIAYSNQINKALSHIKEANQILYKEQGRTSEHLSWYWKRLVGMLIISCFIIMAIFFFHNYIQKGSRKDMEQKNIQTNIFLDIILENIPTMVFIKNAKDLRFVRFNKAGEDLLGFERKDLIGKNDYDFFPKDQADFFTNKDREVLSGKEIVDIPEEQIETKFKGIRWLHTKKIPLLFENDQPQYLLGISLDITEEKNAVDKIKKFNEELEHKVKERTATLEETSIELKAQISERVKAEEEMKKANKQLIKINNDLDNFIYTASHDLRAPISNIEGLINALTDSFTEETKVSEDVKMILGMIHKSIGRFKGTIQDLTDIAKVQKETGGDLEEINIRRMIEDELLEIKQEIVNSGARIKIDTDSCPTIKFPRKDLKSIIYNLLNNAIKYKSPLRIPEIKISTKPSGGFTLLSVKDNGLGIPSDQMDKVFLMFKRLHTHVEGTGVGLYIVKRMVENQGGRIEVESELGKGSKFNVYLMNKNQ